MTSLPFHPGSADPHVPDDLYAASPPWDIGRPQAAFRALAGAIRGLTARFLHRDALRLAALGESFDTATGSDDPHRLARADIAGAFTDGWHLESIEPSTIEVTTEPSAIPAWLATLTRV